MFNNFQRMIFNNVAFLAPTPADRDYDLNFDGWVGDYQDPSTYLNPFNAEDGFYLKIFGLDAQEDKDKIASLGLDTYTKMLKNADSENKDVAKRYEKYAEAQAWWLTILWLCQLCQVVEQHL